VIDSEPPALGVRVGLDERDQLRGAPSATAQRSGSSRRVTPADALARSPLGTIPMRAPTNAPSGFAWRSQNPMPRHQRQPSAEQPPNRSSELQRRRVAQSTEQPPPARIEPGWWSPTWRAGRNISARDGSTRSWEECAAAAAMNRGLVGVERGGGRAGLGRVRVGVWFGPY